MAGDYDSSSRDMGSRRPITFHRVNNIQNHLLSWKMTDPTGLQTHKHCH